MYFRTNIWVFWLNIRHIKISNSVLAHSILKIFIFQISNCFYLKESLTETFMYNTLVLCDWAKRFETECFMLWFLNFGFAVKQRLPSCFDYKPYQYCNMSHYFILFRSRQEKKKFSTIVFSRNCFYHQKKHFYRY